MANCEQSISKIKLIKTYLSLSMAQEKLSSLGIISIENEEKMCLNIEEIID